MHSTMTRTLCRLLIVLVAWMPIQGAQAGLISADQAVSSAQNDRAAVLNFVQRADVSRQLQSLGVDPASAKDRIAAMTDAEVQSLAGGLHALPAGGDGFTILILVGIIVWIAYHWK